MVLGLVNEEPDVIDTIRAVFRQGREGTPVRALLLSLRGDPDETVRAKAKQALGDLG